MNKQQLRELVSQAVMGDEDAIDQLTEVIGANQGPAPDPEFAQFVAEEFRPANRDLVNPQDWDALTKVDARLAQEHPELGYRQRLPLAADAVRRGSVGAELSIEAQHVSAIEQMRLERDPNYRASLFAARRAQQAAQDEDRRFIRRPPSNLTDDEGADAIERMAQGRPGARFVRHNGG